MAKRKKKNQTTLISLLVVLVLLAGFYVWYLNRDKFGASSQEESGANSNSDLVIDTMDPELVNKIHFKNEKADMTFVLEDDTWVYTEDKLRPIKQNYVQNMISLVDEIKADRLVNEKPEDIKQFGLETPFAYIEAYQSDGKRVAISIGNKVTGGQGYYAMVEGREPVYIFPTIYGTYLSYSDANMTQVEHGPNIESNDIYHLEVLQKDGDDFELIYDPDSVYHIAGTPFLSWAILKPYEEVYSAESSKVSDLLANYSNFNFLSCIEYDSKDFAGYGLEEPRASVFIEYYEQYTEELDEPETDPDTGEEITTRTVTEEKSFRLFIGDTDDNGDYYVRKDGDNAVYTMNDTIVDKMLNIDTFSILSTFVNIYNIETVNKIDIEIEGKPYSMEITKKTVTNEEGEEEEEKTYYYNGDVVEEDVFKKVYQAMIGAKLDSQLNKEVSVDGLEPVLTLSYHVEGISEPFTTSYYPYDESFYLIDSGQTIRFVADRRKIDKIIDAIKEFKYED